MPTIKERAAVEKKVPARAVPADFFRPTYFLVGALIGFALCCFLGYLTTFKNQFGDIPRFNVYSGPQACFFPTIRQLIAFAKAKKHGDQILVIVGGSSVLNGVGQSNEELWTRKLQSLLGPRYAVVNLALRSCNAYEGAYFVAEALAKQNEKVIFVTCAQPHTRWKPLGAPPYAYLHWDAKFQNLLYDFPARDAAVTAHERQLPDGSWTPEALTELKLSQFLNSQFHFLELWSTIGYRYLFTAYKPVTGEQSFLPRKKLPDNMEANETFPMPDVNFAKTYFPGVLAGLYNWDRQHTKWVKDEPVWDECRKTLDTNVAPQLRSRTMVLELHHNPDMCRMYETPSELQRDRLAFADADKLLRSMGIRSIECCADYHNSDFRDAVHLGASGGAKLAEQTAAGVREIAADLGYANPSE